MIQKKICVVTGARSEYGLLFPIMKKIESSNKLKLKIVATNAHLSKEFGETYKQIEEDGFKIDEKVENLLYADTKSAVAKSTGLASFMLSDVYSRINPDVVLLLGDRYETHAAATSAMLMNIPIAHIHGGEITQGAVDEKIRHSITKMSSIHFTATDLYNRRVVQMGEAPETVFTVGAPGVDRILSLEYLKKTEIESELGWKIKKPTALFTFHPETLSSQESSERIRKILSIISNIGINVIFSYSNADHGGRAINREIDLFTSNNKFKYLAVKNLGQLKYLSLLKYIDIVIGNSSSGIIEAASFNKPVVNIGDRQKGRMQSGNVINSEVDNLMKGVKVGLSKKFIEKCSKIKNVYGNGQTAERIVKLLEDHELILEKSFFEQ
jgi:GDP/UDP-N,N'-diacetylbacillosamine 2-epimerase (hydrolysing)